MSAGKMHADEVNTDVSLVARLLNTQFPQWAELPIAPVPSSGTDNALYRLGDDMVVRLPRIHWAVEQVDKEHQWLPRLASFLPLAVPVPLVKGNPGEGYPWHWSVYQWLEGENATVERIADQRQTATDLARFIAALQRIDVTGGPPPGPHNSYRGEPLTMRSARTHGAMYLSAETRDVFRAALQVDDATWARGRVWALSVGLIALPYYQNSNPVLAGIARRAIDEALGAYSANG